MFRINRISWPVLGLPVVLSMGCPAPVPTGDAGVADAGVEDAGVADAGEDAGVADAGEDGGVPDGGDDGGVADGGNGDAGLTSFRVRMENISGDTALPTPFSPGVYVVHGMEEPLFTAGAADRGEGLERIAEDGDPTELADVLMANRDLFRSGVFNTPEGASMPAPIMPGEAYEFTVQATPDARWLSFATMLAQSNDLFVAPEPGGIALFETTGAPIASLDITADLTIWDVGSEQNQAPGTGPDQAPRQAAPNSGRAEGVVGTFSNTTRGLPLATDVLDVEVTEMAGTYTFTIVNASDTSGAIRAPISPVFFALHDETQQLFTGGMAAGDALERLAEDGNPADLVSATMGGMGFGEVGSVGVTEERPGDAAGPAAPGERYTFSVTPTMDAPILSFASMLAESNDVFAALPPEGVRLLDMMGMPRSAMDVQTDILTQLALWDAGTEANEVPGVGPTQAPRQMAANTGPADPDATVRPYADATNDLAGPNAGGFIQVTVAMGNMMGSMDVTVTNTSDETVYPGRLSPVVYAVHSPDAALFQTGMPASEALEALAEDGDGAAFTTLLSGAMGVLAAGVADTATGAGMPGPLMPGESYTFTVTPDAEHPLLSIASMIVPSNDTFAAFGPEGVRLLDESGEPRSIDDIQADINEALVAWDAGTEANQASAAGPDQAPYQAAPDTGAPEGGGVVRVFDDPVWVYPPLDTLLRVTVERLR